MLKGFRDKLKQSLEAFEKTADSKLNDLTHKVKPLQDSLEQKTQPIAQKLDKTVAAVGQLDLVQPKKVMIARTRTYIATPRSQHHSFTFDVCSYWRRLQKQLRVCRSQLQAHQLPFPTFTTRQTSTTLLVCDPVCLVRTHRI